MELEIVFQDGTIGERCLRDIIVELANDATICTVISGFASAAGVDSVLGGEGFEGLRERGEVRVIVGVDAVTDRAALERLKALSEMYDDFSVEVFSPEASGLFHPKVWLFRYDDGSVSTVVGSGNLTSGGLGRNREVFSVVRGSDGEAIEHNLDELLEHDQLGEVNEAILKRAEKNVFRGTGGASSGRQDEEADVVTVPSEEDEETNGEVFVGYLPKAGGRWAQAHLNRAIHEGFIGLPLGSDLTLRERRADGSVGELEERQIVYSDTNKNIKIEVGAAPGGEYPDDGKPIIVMRRVAQRAFDYCFLMPGDDGHVELDELLVRSEAGGEALGRGTTRIIASLAVLRKAWPECPFV